MKLQEQQSIMVGCWVFFAGLGSRNSAAPVRAILRSGGRSPLTSDVVALSCLLVNCAQVVRGLQVLSALAAES